MLREGLEADQCAPRGMGVAFRCEVNSSGYGQAGKVRYHRVVEFVPAEHAYAHDCEVAEAAKEPEKMTGIHHAVNGVVFQELHSPCDVIGGRRKKIGNAAVQINKRDLRIHKPRQGLPSRIFSTRPLLIANLVEARDK